MSQEWILHTVVFTLKHEKGSVEEEQFLADGESILTTIPGVTNFKVFRQVSQKNSYDFGLHMEFSGQSEYEAYNNHPAHTKFVQERWLTEVEQFLEIDYKEYRA
ncbi:hypothetical protein FHS18_006870 [Paenibacillus phyllosphaerae]|uniref:Stress-response A/B barrel domain-containing protein n=1 Tax=Paenibacillus phyllosphaerae TaxID=274593 RepID=A0A7W5B5F2_9BACL|nr:hypothetical protein [Paenibacillus phyllosphaerae]